MKLTIFGGTGGVGRHVIPMALDAGHEVTAFARSPGNLPRVQELRVVEGQLDEAERVAAAIRGADAVLSALGPRGNTPDQAEIFGSAMETITRAMEHSGVRRLVAVSGAGVLVPEDKVTLGRRFVRLLLHVLAKHIAASKEREYEVIQQTDLDWVLVRPPRIVPGPATGEYRVFADQVPSPKISQGDVADLMLACLTDDRWIRRAPIPGY